VASNYFAILVAAGNGKRMQAQIPKQYLKLCGKTLLEHAIAPLLAEPCISNVVVVTAQDDEHWPRLEIAQHPKIIVAEGGEERIDSCLNGLRALQGIARGDDWILDHDAARPCLQAADLKQLLDSLQDNAVGGILAYPVVDTLKRGDDEQMIVGTVDRNNLWHAATPQMFRYDLLFRALARAKRQADPITDNASAIELLGYRPQIINCSRQNIKLTYPDDLKLAEFYLNFVTRHPRESGNDD